jgi:chorismate mutase
VKDKKAKSNFDFFLARKAGSKKAKSRTKELPSEEKAEAIKEIKLPPREEKVIAEVTKLKEKKEKEPKKSQLVKKLRKKSETQF